MKKENYIKQLEKHNKELFKMVSDLQELVKIYEGIMENFKAIYEGGEPMIVEGKYQTLNKEICQKK